MAIAALLGSPAYSADFTQTYFFGDSLTDAGSYGGARFTVNPGKVWAQFLAEDLGTNGNAFGIYNLTVVPAPLVQPLGGTNYAQGGARETDLPGVGVPGANPISSQVSTFLTGSPTANPNALYAIWGGANDVFFQAALAGSGAITSEQAQANIRAAAAAQIAQIGRLKAAGARYILVPNLPDIGKTPAAILQGVQSVATTAGADTAKTAQALGAATLALRQTTTTAATQAAAQQAAVANAAAVLGVPAATVQGAVDQVRSGFTGLATLFNLALNSGIGQVGVEVIPVNVTGIFNELIANPAAFGVTNVTGTACNTTSSLQCSSAALGQVDLTQRYLFADSVHPTPEVHAILADLILAQLNAPQQVSLLSYVAQRTTETQVGAINEQIRLANGPAARSGSSGVNLFIGGGFGTLEVDTSGSNDGVETNPVNLTLGANLPLNPRSSIGLAWSLGQGSADFSRGGGFDYSSNLLAVYYGMNGPWWLNSLVGMGFVDYRDITRSINLGGGSRTEQGNTSGETWLIGFETGYDLNVGSVTTGPVLHALYQEQQVTGYTENGESSTAMAFDNHTRKSLLTGLGWRASLPVATSFGTVEPYLKASVYKENKDQDGGVSARVVGLSGSFTLPGYAPDDQYAVIDIGVRARLSASSAAGLSLSTVTGQDDTTHSTLNLSYSRRF